MNNIFKSGKPIRLVTTIFFFSLLYIMPSTFAQGSTVGLVGHWALEEDNTLTTLVDSSSSANNGTVTSPASLVSEIGKRGYGLIFDGSNDYAVVADTPSLDMTTAITIAAWVKPSIVRTQRILRKVSAISATDGFELFLRSSTTGQVGFRLNGGTTLSSTTLYPSDGNTWIHVAATYDGTNMKLYINGTQEGGNLASSNIVANNVGLGIGADHLGNDKIKGTIDDARIYNRALSLAEIQELITVWAPPSVSIQSNGPGYALNFNGTDDYVTVPDAVSLDITGSITLEAWVKPSKTATQRIIRKVNTILSQGYSLFLSSGGYFSVRFNNDDNLTTGRVNTSNLYSDHLNEWIHIAATYDGTTIRTYFNGVADNTLASAFTISANAADLSIGATTTGTARFQGVMDEVRIWNVARTESQIQNNMCKKLAGTETGLVGYWRFDETSRSFAQDETSNQNEGILTKSNGGEHVWSGAAVGDASISDYLGSVAADFTATLTLSSESFTATGSTGTITGVQVYRVDDNSVRSGSTVPTGYTADPLRYWGVKLIGSGVTTYDLVYDYTGHSGITSEASLKLVKRTNLSDASWLDAGATLDVLANTLTKTGETGTEYALASTSDPLPVELTSFTAKVISNSSVKLEWKTETELNNYGFEIQRINNNGQNNSSDWITIGFVEGSGNSNSPKFYSFTDDKLRGSSSVLYRLKQVDNDGQFEYSSVVEVNFAPTEFALYQNYPNPFNPSTKIRYSIVQESFVTIKVYDIIGNEVRTLVSEKQTEGNYEIDFRAENFTSGVYIYRMQAGNFVQMRKMMILK